MMRHVIPVLSCPSERHKRDCPSPSLARELWLVFFLPLSLDIFHCLALYFFDFV